MKNKILHKLILAILALALTGCQLTAPVAKTQSEAKVSKLVDSMESEAYPFAAEYPAITADLSFKGSVLETSLDSMAVKSAPAEVRAVWISFLELQTLLTGKSANEFRRNMSAVFENCKNYGLNTVILQVRPYADAMYKSSYFPWSYIITGTEGKNPGFDPLQIMVEEARLRGLRIEAWVNPYRIRAADNKNALANNNYAKMWLDKKDNSVIVYKGVTSYNPASSKAQNLIVNGAVELVKNYDIDGIHIDDYFYPTTDKEFDKQSYSAYTKAGGGLNLADWRRANVETLIKKMYKAIKAANPKVLFGISPQSSLDNNYNAHYLDVAKISSTNGYCDYICPQIYFGYKNKSQPYAETLEMWNNMVTASNVKLYVGLASYKVGTTDAWAGEGKNEWAQNSDLLKRMTLDARETNNYGGIALYRYDFIFAPESNVKAIANKEHANLKGLFN